MSVLSKPLFFQSAHTNGVSDQYRRVEDISNAHFWIEKNGVIFDPTDIEPYEGGRRLYVPFTDTEQKDLYRQWLEDAERLWGCGELEVLWRIHNWKLSFPMGTKRKCWFNAIKHQHDFGGTLVCGLMGHYSKELGHVDVDYGY